MSLSIISFTENGIRLSRKIKAAVEDSKDESCNRKVNVFTKCSHFAKELSNLSISYIDEAIQSWAKTQMEQRNEILFIGACGIAVRAIAPWVTDKLCDSPVLVMDEKGQYIIPILSGHVGGANELARQLGEQIGAIPVITTATDLNHKFAVDVFAQKNGLRIVNKDGIAKISSKVLAGKKITMSVENGHIGEKIPLPEEIKMIPYPPVNSVDILVTAEDVKRIPYPLDIQVDAASENIEASALIYLQPKEYVIGMGCKKGKEYEKINQFIGKSLEEAGIDQNQIFALASIDKKKEEEGFLAWSRKQGCAFLTFSVEQLQAVEGYFHTSSFVKEQVGVDNVCERSALCGCGLNGRLIYEKHAEDGMTIAIAKREWSVSFDEE